LARWNEFAGLAVRWTPAAANLGRIPDWEHRHPDGISSGGPAHRAASLRAMSSPHRRDDGTVATDSVHPTRIAAKTRAAGMTTDHAATSSSTPPPPRSPWGSGRPSGRCPRRLRGHLGQVPVLPGHPHPAPVRRHTPLSGITRMSVKAWLIEDSSPGIAQARRLGHKLPGVRGYLGLAAGRFRPPGSGYRRV